MLSGKSSFCIQPPTIQALHEPLELAPTRTSVILLSATFAVIHSSFGVNQITALPNEQT